jgi:squalene-hopene/tetraprenyl-beta-curcumene cyclase
MEIDDCVARGSERLWSQQRADGSWNVSADMGPACTAQVAVAFAWAGVLSADEARDIRHWLCAQQGRDGSFLPYPYARAGSVGATACAWAALVACGASTDDPAVVAARRWIDAHGGLAPLRKALLGGDLALLYLCLAGLVPADRLPKLPLGWALRPRLVDLASRVVHGGVTFGALQLGVISRALRGEVPPPRIGDELRRWIDTWQNCDGSINANALQTAVTLVALRAIGDGPGERRFDLAVQSLRSLAHREPSGMWFATFESDVWTTALNTSALLAAGASPRDERIVRALEYLLRCQSETPQPRINNRRPDAVRTGGWAFQRDNVTMVDNDDTGMVLALLGDWLARDGQTDLLHDSVARAVTRGRRFVLSMQNDDGGWAAFVRGLPRRRRGPFTLRTSLGDPSTEDVTARVLLGLAHTGRDERAIAAALGFLRRFQQPSGAFWGRWVVNYVPSTAYVVSACARLGVEAGWLERAVGWLRSVQNADGGWGDWVDSYADPARAGKAASTAPVTGLVLGALVDAGLASDPAAERAARFLVERELPGGGWSNANHLAVFVPPDAFYEYPGANNYAPLQALARFREARGRRVNRHRVASELEDRLAELAHRGDPEGDAAAAALDRDRQWGAFFMGRNARFAEPVRALVAATSRLPSSIDPARVLAGQRCFARHSWAMANAFFFASMPASYAVPKGAAVLQDSGSLVRDARRRLLDTGHFMWSVMTPGALEPGGDGFREILRVRLVHARIRRALVARGWRRDNPIDQAAMLGTILLLSSTAIRGLERLGVALADHDAENLLHAWRGVAELVGVEPELLPRSLAEARQQEQVLQRHLHGASDAGAALANELVRCVRAYLPLRAFDDWPIDMIRHTAGDELADLLALPEGGRTRPLIERTVERVRHAGNRPSRMDGVVHGFTIGIIEAQRVSSHVTRHLLPGTAR